jgi:hypothetical protein
MKNNIITGYEGYEVKKSISKLTIEDVDREYINHLVNIRYDFFERLIFGLSLKDSLKSGARQYTFKELESEIKDYYDKTGDEKYNPSNNTILNYIKTL